MRVAGISGGISGGTYESLSQVNAEAFKDKDVFKILINPYGLNPAGEQNGLDSYDLRSVVFDNSSKNWIGPFLMAGIILLVAMIGAIVLTMQIRTTVRRQHIFQQVSRDADNAIYLVSSK
jgi:hypothetical protein